MKKTTFAKQSELSPNWILVDAENQILGRLATQVASMLKGKHKTHYTPHLVTGDYIIVINADKIKLTGNKRYVKTAKRYSGWSSGLKEIPYDTLMKENPTFVIEKAVKGMLPDNKLRPDMMKQLKVYAGADHPHTAQKPELIKL